MLHWEGLKIVTSADFLARGNIVSRIHPLVLGFQLLNSLFPSFDRWLFSLLDGTSLEEAPVVVPFLGTLELVSNVGSPIFVIGYDRDVISLFFGCTVFWFAHLLYEVM